MTHILQATQPADVPTQSLLNNTLEKRLISSIRYISRETRFVDIFFVIKHATKLQGITFIQKYSTPSQRMNSYRSLTDTSLDQSVFPGESIGICIM